jgi:uncharacterized protein (DUF58 family)
MSCAAYPFRAPLGESALMADRSRFRTLTTRGRALLACGIVLVAAGIVLGFRDITRIGMLLVLLAVLARLLARRRPPRLAIDRTVSPTRLQPDEQADITVEFTNLGTRSTTLYTAEEHVDPILGDPPRFLLPRLQPNHRRRLTYHVRSQVRGRHRLGPVSLRQEDPFGLTHVELVVRPRVVPLGPGQPSGSGFGVEGEVPQMVALHGEDDVSIRTYRDGDDLRKVHWPATAHRGELMVRQEDRPARRSAVLLLDARTSGHSDGIYSPSFEWAVSALASIAVRLSGLGYTLHLATRESLAAGQLEYDLHAEDVLEALAVVERGSDDEHERLVQATHELTERTGGLVAVITSVDDLSLSDLATLRRPGTSAQAMIVDRAAFADGSDQVGVTTLGHQELLHRAGWRAVPVSAQTTIAHAWDLLTASGRSHTGVA